jgi:ABC-type polar amino acid transport system ATPase subunit
MDPGSTRPGRLFGGQQVRIRIPVAFALAAVVVLVAGSASTMSRSS